MRLIKPSISISLALLILAGLIGAARGSSSAQWATRVDPWVLEHSASSEVEFLVFLAEQADLSAAANLPTKLARGTYVYETLSTLAERTQAPLIRELDRLGVPYQSYWIANMIWVRGDAALVQALATRPDVAHLYANPTVQMQVPQIDGQPAPHSLQGIEWNISQVGAPDVWAEGYTGQGVVIGGQDTGYDWDHPALINQYRGWDGASADHDYNWNDAIHSGGGVCGADSPEPCDDHNHGTHTMGTMVGDDGGNNQIGMAPGARWIGCRNMNQGAGTPATYSECYQWFIAPTDQNGQNPMPAMAPHVINNSWSCPPSEGCTNPDALLTVVQNVRAAGILTAHSAGNSGSSCSSVDDPAAIYDESFTVGATNNLDAIASFSSRGPVTADNSGRRKPDVSAPGVNIYSSVRGGSYQGGWSGTSMAAPHVAGLAALLISAQPALAGQVDALEALMETTALPRTTTQSCGGDGPNDVPNNVYGWGRIDAPEAFQSVQHALGVEKAAPPLVAPGTNLTYTLALTHSHPLSPTSGVVVTDVVPAGTTFVTATQPHSFDGAVVRWDLPMLGPGASQAFTLVVGVPTTATTPIVNQVYGASSDDVPFVAGLPVTTPLDLAYPPRAYFPLIVR